jgi:hypothetical protein
MDGGCRSCSLLEFDFDGVPRDAAGAAVRRYDRRAVEFLDQQRALPPLRAQVGAYADRRGQNAGPKYTDRAPAVPGCSSPIVSCSGTCALPVDARAITRTFIVSIASVSDR